VKSNGNVRLEVKVANSVQGKIENATKTANIKAKNFSV
jgi:hypothetical protein